MKIKKTNIKTVTLATALMLACALLLGFTQCKKEQSLESDQSEGLTGSNTDLSESWNSTYTNSNVSTKITAAGGSALNWAVYWSTTESSDSNVW